MGRIVVLAHDLSPSETAGLDTRKSPRLRHRRGRGGQPHGDRGRRPGDPRGRRIWARRWNSPETEPVRRSSTATKGLVVLDPDAPTLERYRRKPRLERTRPVRRGWPTSPTFPAETLDGHRRSTSGETSSSPPRSSLAWTRRGDSGIGLYRTEFLFLNADRPPTEDEQFVAYSKPWSARAGGGPVTFRTLDLGSDKLVSYRNGRSARAQPGARLAEPPALAPRPRPSVRTSAPGDSQGRPSGGCPGHVPPGLDPGRVPPGSRDRSTRSPPTWCSKAGSPSKADDLPVGVMVEVPATAVMADQLRQGGRLSSRSAPTT